MSVHVYPLAGGITTLSFLLLEATVHDVNLSQNNLASDSLDSTHFVIGPKIGLITTEPVVVESESLEMEMGVNALRGLIGEPGAT